MKVGNAPEDKLMTFVYGATHNGFITKNSHINSEKKRFYK